MSQEKLIQQFRKLALADKAFEQCLHLTQYMLGARKDIKIETVGFCMISGICVTYCKNFFDSDGNGSLPSSYLIFDSDELKRTHEDLMEARNGIYAHRDLMRDAELRKGELNPDLTWVHITFHGPSDLEINTQENHFNPDRLPAVKALIEFQRNRLKPDLSAKLLALAAGKKYPLGSYVLGETFP